MVAVQASPLHRAFVMQRMDRADIPAIACETQQEEKGNTAEHRPPPLQTQNEDGHAESSTGDETIGSFNHLSAMMSR